jgi:abhydrolase domain-containing protein 17
MGSVMAKSVVETCMKTTIYQPPAPSYQKASVHFIKTIRGDKIAVRCISPSDSPLNLNSKYRDSRRVIIYSHGNAVDIGGCYEICDVLAHMLDAHVIVYDYPNYGVSSKTAICESVLNSSIESVYSRCMEMEIPADKLVLIGQSLGSVPTLYLASRVYAKYCAIVLISPLASAFRTVIDDAWVPAFLSPRLDRILFNNLQAIENIHAAVAIVHGFDDDVVDISSAELLHSKIPLRFRHAPLYISAGHNDIYDESNLVDVTAYLQEFMRGSPENVSSDATQEKLQPPPS